MCWTGLVKLSQGLQAFWVGRPALYGHPFRFLRFSGWLSINDPYHLRLRPLAHSHMLWHLISEQSGCISSGEMGCGHSLDFERFF